MALPVNAWEAPALGALEQKPVPNAFPVRAGALLFPERDRPGLVPVVVDLKTAPLTFQPAADGKTYTSDFAVLVRFLDQQNQVVRKVSQHYEVKRPDRRHRAREAGRGALLSRAGAAARRLHDGDRRLRRAVGQVERALRRRSKCPKRMPAKLRMSSLVLVKRGEKVPEKDRRADNPLLVNDVVIYPNLGEPVSKAAKEVGFYLHRVSGRRRAGARSRASSCC